MSGASDAHRVADLCQQVHTHTHTHKRPHTQTPTHPQAAEVYRRKDASTSTQRRFEPIQRLEGAVAVLKRRHPGMRQVLAYTRAHTLVCVCVCVCLCLCLFANNGVTCCVQLTIDTKKISNNKDIGLGAVEAFARCVCACVSVSVVSVVLPLFFLFCFVCVCAHVRFCVLCVSMLACVRIEDCVCASVCVPTDLRLCWHYA